eukprot:649289-Amphidinium_carterae.1
MFPLAFAKGWEMAPDRKCSSLQMLGWSMQNVRLRPATCSDRAYGSKAQSYESKVQAYGKLNVRFKRADSQ